MPSRLAAAGLLLTLFGYGVFVATPIITGPSITIASPESFETPEGNQIHIEGRAHHTETLWLNGAPLLMDQSGRFSTLLTLPSGGAILSLTATDRFGREITERRSVYIN